MSGSEETRRYGKALKANLAGLWRHRIGDHRLACKIGDEQMTVLVLAAGHRKDVYE
ncbi:type II toxin-antitoxin system RelE/ParE family toxin [Akkermansiaceae bacterium]|nr:type II toxin-antitoxin system RelE/ParE family toxin [Akkermansiaceae bacterium]